MFSVILLLGAVAGHSQATTATIYGSVSDPSGARIAGTTVTATNEATAAAVTVTTNDLGEFTLNFLPVGRYSLSIKASGFKEKTQQNVELSAGQRLRLSYTMEVGEVTEKVLVTAETPLVNSVNPEQQISHTTLEVTELPLPRRDWTNLLNVGAGLQVRGSGGGTGVVMNGLAPGALGLTVDGTQASGSAEDTSLSMFGGFNIVKVVSLEAISEVNVTKGIASAEFANTLSGNVGLITRTGTNEYHGSLFENYQGRVLNARNQFLATRPPEVFNQFGGSIGLPVIKNRLFFFGVYEGYREQRFATFNNDVATSQFRADAIAAVPAYKQFFDQTPLPNQPVSPGASVGRFIGFGSRGANDDHMVVRADYHATSNSRLSGRYTRGRPDLLTPRFSAANPRTFIGFDDAVSASVFHFRPSLSSETRFGFKRNDVERLDGIFTLAIPTIGGLGFSGNGGELLVSKGKGWSFEEVIAFNKGRHSVKFGGIFQFQNQSRNNAEVPEFTYASVGDFLANIPSTIQVTFGLRPYLIKEWSSGYFIQDDFKIRANLVLNLGLRYDYYSVPTERDGRLFNRDGLFGYGPLRSPDSIQEADRNNFAPRVGFAWSVDASGKTVLRGGFGVFYTRSPFRNTLELIRNSLEEPFRVRFSRTEALAQGLKYPVTNAGVLPLVKNPNAPWTGTTINPEFPNPYSLQWTLSAQRQLTDTIVVDTSYVGNHGVKLLFNRWINLVNRQTGGRPVAGFGEFRHFDTSESTSYHAWQTSLKKRFSSDLLFNAHYAWSSNISFMQGDLTTLDAPQDVDNIRLERGPTPFDIRHRFVADFLYELPFRRLWDAGSRGRALLLNGWQFGGIFSAESGSPFHISQPNSLPGQRVDLVGGPVYLEDGSDGLTYLNLQAFAQVPIVTASGASARPGTLGRNALRGPGFWNVDLSLAKNLAITEGVRLQIRADMFNAFNHTSFSGINTNIRSGSFGLFTSTRGARVVQVNARLSF
jgi:hypothetical protein